MNDLCVGVVTGLKDGRFANQHEIEITTVSGEKVTTYDGISVYEKKQDGSPAKVWPLVKDSYMNGKVFAWSGNVKDSDTKAGPKTYATITWATTVDEIFEGAPAPSGNGEGGGQANGSSDAWGSVSTAPEASTPPAAWSETKQSLGSPPKTEWDERTLYVECSWAIKSAIQLLGAGAGRVDIKAKAADLLELRDEMVEERR